jgi:hypothetical protein
MTGSVTSPPGGATITWTVISTQFTVTAAPYCAAAAQSGAGYRVNAVEASWMIVPAMLLWWIQYRRRRVQSVASSDFKKGHRYQVSVGGPA